MKKKILILVFSMLCLFANAQSSEKRVITEEDYANQEVEMADTFRSEGKIYVVVAVIIAILSGIIVYLVVLDKKIAKLEREVN